MPAYALIALFLAEMAGDSASAVSVVVPDSEVVGQLGSSVVLPCWLTSQTDASPMEVRWYRRESFTMPIFHYKDRGVQTETQPPEYENRTSLVSRDPLTKPGGLTVGDVSLELKIQRVEDAGPYVCYVSSTSSYDSQTVVLNVTATGSIPTVSVRQTTEGLVNVSCSSSGWFPEPRVTFSKGGVMIRPEGITSSQRNEDLYSVTGWVFLKPVEAELFSCFFSLSEEETKEGRISLHTPQSADDHSGSWKALFAVALLICLTLAGVVIFQYRQKKKEYSLKQQGYSVTQQEEHQSDIDCIEKSRQHAGYSVTQQEEHQSDIDCIEKSRQHAVAIKLDSSREIPGLTVTEDRKIVRDAQHQVNSDSKSTDHLFILGKPGFTSGCAYWEVGLFAPNREDSPKRSWKIGVAGGLPYDIFFLQYDQNRLITNTKPSISIHLPPLKKVGVFLEYDKGQLSFYDVTKGQVLMTMTTQFKGEMFPLFNPGIGDTSPMKILDFPAPPKQDTGQETLPSSGQV